jgi:hypothetical protein
MVDHSAARNRKGRAHTPSTKLKSNAMARSASAKQGPAHHHYSAIGKRQHQHDMVPSATYTYGSAGWPSTGTAAPQQPTSDNMQVWDPEAYITSKLTTSSDPPPPTPAKRQKVMMYDASMPPTFDASPAYNNSTYVPTMQMRGDATVSPSSTSMSSQPSQNSLSFSEAMSRHSSMTTCTSMTSTSMNDLDMSRVGSSFSDYSHHQQEDITFLPFELQGSDHSFLSVAAAEKPSSSFEHTTGGYDGGMRDDVAHLLSNVGFVGQNLPLLPSFPSAVVGHGDECTQAAGFSSHGQAQEMQRSASDQSNSSTSSASSTEMKATERRRKHIENARQTIAPKSLPNGPKSSSSIKTSKESNKSQNSHELAIRKKEAISKTRYVRPSHPKQYCTLCDDYPGGFRGEHELRRHYDRAHAETRKVWICVEPTTKSKEGWWPAKPLGICKQCKQRKEYNVYYNAAAHLRRAHFCPRKRGRKARGEERESRAGKAGGDWPPIEWLKANGWLKEIEVSSAQSFGQNAVPSQFDTAAFDNDEEEEHAGDEEAEGDDDFDYAGPPDLDAQQMSLAAEHLGLQPYPLQTFHQTADFTFGYPTPVDSSSSQMCFPPNPAFGGGLQAPAMSQTVSAPGALGSSMIFNGGGGGMMYDGAVLYPLEQFGQVM